LKNREILRVILAFMIFDKYNGCRLDKSFDINCVRKRLMRKHAYEGSSEAKRWVRERW